MDHLHADYTSWIGNRLNRKNVPIWRKGEADADWKLEKGQRMYEIDWEEIEKYRSQREEEGGVTFSEVGDEDGDGSWSSKSRLDCLCLLVPISKMLNAREERPINIWRAEIELLDKERTSLQIK